MTSAPETAPVKRHSPVRLSLAIAGWLTLLLAVAYLFGRKHIHNWMLNRDVAKVTRSLPECDSVEIFRLTPPSTAPLTEADRKASPDRFPIFPHRFAPITARLKLTGSEAKEFLDLWRQQKVGQEFLSLQHRPKYGFRAASGSANVFETSLCFDCQTFVVTLAGNDVLWGMDAKTDAAKALEKLLEQKLPP